MKALTDLEAHKLPAMRQAGLKLAAKPQILLFSRSGFGSDLIEQAATRDDLRLVDLDELNHDI